VVEFLQALWGHLRAPLMILWDGATIHRSKLVKEFIASTGGQLELQPLPAYAPELNPVEYLWAHLKEHEIANLVVRHAWELSLKPRPLCAACDAAPESSLPASLKLNCGLNVTLLHESQ